MPLDQLAHTGVAGSFRGPTQDDRNNVFPVAANRRHQIVSGSFGVTGLDTVNAGYLPKQAVVVVHHDPVIPKAPRRKKAVVAGKPILNCTS